MYTPLLLAVYLASCAPVESWYLMCYRKGPHLVHPFLYQPPTSLGGAAPGTLPPRTEVVAYFMDPRNYAREHTPAWMQFIYAPVHWLEQVHPKIGEGTMRYWDWCHEQWK